MNAAAESMLRALEVPSPEQRSQKLANANGYLRAYLDVISGRPFSLDVAELVHATLVARGELPTDWLLNIETTRAKRYSPSRARTGSSTRTIRRPCLTRQRKERISSE